MKGTALKNSTASSTVISSTSLIDLPLYLISSVSRLYLLPLHFSQGTYTSGKKFISITRIPPPSHTSQRPLFTLNENRPALYPRIFASGIDANNVRMSVKKPQYVAGLLLGVLPIGDWSISITLSICSNPFIVLYSSGVTLEPYEIGRASCRE